MVHRRNPLPVWRVGGALALLVTLSSWRAVHGQDPDPAEVSVPLDSALQLAQKTAAGAFPDLSDYLLYSVTPRSSREIPAACTGRCAGRSGPFPTAVGWWFESIPVTVTP